MADALYTIALIANDATFNKRLNAGAAQQSVPGDPVKWVLDNRYTIASAPTWAEKVDYWLLSNPDATPVNGWATDVSVISDNEIIAQIQAMLATG